MDYKEKWITLKNDLESTVNCELQSVVQMDIKNKNRLTAYRNILDYMYKLDGNEKPIQKSEEEELMDDIYDEIFNEPFEGIFED